MNISNLNRLNNEFRALMNEAEAVYLRNDGKHTGEEGLCYQKAAEICTKLAGMTIGAESLHWIEQQQQCQSQMRIIANAINPKKYPLTGKKEEVADDEDSVEEDKTTDKEPTDKNTTKNAYADGIKQEVINSWFKDDPGYGFDAVTGMDDVVNTLKNSVRDESMRELVDYLGLPTVQSFFFYGPPGCGKTFVIEAFVHELKQQGYKYMSVASADIHSKFSGEADKILKRIFAEAVENAPCVLFMDEIDGVCQSREMPNLSDFNMQLTTTFLTCFNQLLKADKDRKSVLFIAATNYHANVDSAMLERMELIPIPMPDETVRENVLRSKLNKVALDDDVSFAEIAEKTEGYSHRDLNRVAQKLLLNVFKNVSECVGRGENSASGAVEMLKQHDFRINRKMITDVLDSYKPKPNADIERSLNEFEAKA